MLVDNPPHSASVFSDFGASSDLNEFLNTDVFLTTSPASPTTSTVSSSHDTDSQLVTTPPLTTIPSFPDVQIQDPSSSGYNFDALTASSTFGLGELVPGHPAFDYLEEQMKQITAASPSPLPAYDFFGSLSGSGASTSTTDPTVAGLSGIDLASLLAMASAPVVPAPASAFASSSMAIDPQLMGTPSSQDFSDGEDSDEDMDEDEEEEPPTRSSARRKAAGKNKENGETSKLTLTITPVKVGGHGKARKGTVQSGGVTKKTAVPPSTSSTFSSLSSLSSVPGKNKENVSSRSSTVSDTDKLLKGAPMVLGVDQDELPEDWRPAPEVFQKMSSKEKRQLRNKISARNFRVRRKEYISTLELDIAERDRLLQAIRTELGSTQSENLALRQEIAALKRALLEGRRGSSGSPTAVKGEPIDLTLTSEDVPVLNLPPPAPLPVLSESPAVAAALAAAQTNGTVASAASASTSITPTVNPRKDVGSSGKSSAFWGGVGLGTLGGGMTTVHTALIPEVSVNPFTTNNGIGSVLTNVLQENLNPALNVVNVQQPVASVSSPSAPSTSPVDKDMSGFEGFTELTPFTMKALDAYRMQLWTKMGQQQQVKKGTNSPSPSSSPSSSPIIQAPKPISASPASVTSSNRPITPPPLIGSPSPFTNSHHSPSPNNSPLHLPYPFQLGPGAGFGSTIPSLSLSGHGHHGMHFANPSPFVTATSSAPPGAVHGGNGLTGLAASLPAKYLTASNKANLPGGTAGSGGDAGRDKLPAVGRELSALLARKDGSGSHSSHHHHHHQQQQHKEKEPLQFSAATLGRKDGASSSVVQGPTQDQAFAAALASQTLLKKLGSAFWDAFAGSGSSGGSSGSASSSGSGPSSNAAFKPWDAEKVQKVLEGRAVVRVVDLPEAVAAPSVGVAAASSIPSAAGHSDSCGASITSVLEESMRSLTLGKK